MKTTRRSLLKLFPSFGLAFLAPKISADEGSSSFDNAPDEALFRDIDRAVAQAVASLVPSAGPTTQLHITTNTGVALSAVPGRHSRGHFVHCEMSFMSNYFWGSRVFDPRLRESSSFAVALRYKAWPEGQIDWRLSLISDDPHKTNVVRFELPKDLSNVVPFVVAKVKEHVLTPEFVAKTKRISMLAERYNIAS